MVLAQRLPPSSFASDKKLLNFLLHKKEGKGDSEMPIAQSVIYMSTDAIVCTNVSGVIEIINPAVTNILGYTPDQMLGQRISDFFVGNETELAENENEKGKEIKEENNHDNNNNGPVVVTDCEKKKFNSR